MNDKISLVVFFFKQKTAYEMLRSLVGSEMCIRDRLKAIAAARPRTVVYISCHPPSQARDAAILCSMGSVSYTHLTLPTIYSV